MEYIISRFVFRNCAHLLRFLCENICEYRLQNEEGNKVGNP